MLMSSRLSKQNASNAAEKKLISGHLKPAQEMKLKQSFFAARSAAILGGSTGEIIIKIILRTCARAESIVDRFGVCVHSKVYSETYIYF